MNSKPPGSDADMPEEDLESAPPRAIPGAPKGGARDINSIPGARWLLPIFVLLLGLVGWHAAVRVTGSELFPTPRDVALGLAELAVARQPVDKPMTFMERVWHGRLLSYVAASLFRVTWGFGLAVLVGVPFGLLMGWFRWVYSAFNPLIQALRPISPIAWIPVAILWFGVKDAAPIFLIFLASVFPIIVSAAAAVRSVQTVHLRAARNFGLSRAQLIQQVIVPATLPQIITGLRIALGVAWLVVVAAEMIAVSSGLGYLIIDARNAGKRYDLVVAGMFMIGLIGWLLDVAMRKLENLRAVSWAYGAHGH